MIGKPNAYHASDFKMMMPSDFCNKNNLAKFTGFKWILQGF